MTEQVLIGVIRQGAIELRDEKYQLERNGLSKAIKDAVDSLETLINKSNVISPIIERDCVEACKTVVESYEGDGMENMDNRDQVMYDTCKKALANHSL